MDLAINHCFSFKFLSLQEELFPLWLIVPWNYSCGALFFYHLSLFSHSPSPHSSPSHLLSSSFSPTLFSLFITAFQFSILQWDITFYYGIKNYYKSGILQQHKYIIPKFPHIQVWAECGFISLQGPQWAEIEVPPGAAVLFTGPLPRPLVVGRTHILEPLDGGAVSYLSARTALPECFLSSALIAIPDSALHPSRAAESVCLTSFVQPAEENSVLLKGQCEVRPSTVPHRIT